MSYCVNCGVHLKEETKACPLCHTRVINPAINQKSENKTIHTQRPFEEYDNSFDKSLWIKLMSITLLTPATLSILINWVFQKESNML